MYTENRARDVALFAKAVLSNQLARFAPATYMRLTHQTGRGENVMPLLCQEACNLLVKEARNVVKESARAEPRDSLA